MERKMPKPNLLDEYYVWPDEVAKQLGKCPRTLQRWRRLGKAPPIKQVGHLQVCNIQEMREWLLAQQQTT